MLPQLKNFLRRSQEVSPDASQDTQNIGLDPVSESPKKVNKLVIGAVAFLLTGTLFFAIFSGGDDAQSTTTKETTTSHKSTANITDDNLKKIENKAKADASASNKPDEHIHEDEHDHDHEDEHDHNHGDIHNTSKPTPNTSTSNVPSAPAPIVLSDEEREAKEDAKEARNDYKAQVKTRAKEDLEGNRSPIFFAIKQEVKNDASSKIQTPENANDYYNNYSKDSYISVVK